MKYLKKKIINIFFLFLESKCPKNSFIHFENICYVLFLKTLESLSNVENFCYKQDLTISDFPTSKLFFIFTLFYNYLHSIAFVKNNNNFFFPSILEKKKIGDRVLYLTSSGYLSNLLIKKLDDSIYNRKFELCRENKSKKKFFFFYDDYFLNKTGISFKWIQKTLQHTISTIRNDLSFRMFVCQKRISC